MERSDEQYDLACRAISTTRTFVSGISCAMGRRGRFPMGMMQLDSLLVAVPRNQGLFLGDRRGKGFKMVVVRDGPRS